MPRAFAMRTSAMLACPLVAAGVQGSMWKCRSSAPRSSRAPSASRLDCAAETSGFATSAAAVPIARATTLRRFQVPRMANSSRVLRLFCRLFMHG